MLPEEEQLYRKLYKILTLPDINDNIVNYVKKEYNIYLKKLRTKQSEYDTAYTNGYLDALQHMIDLKHKTTLVMQNLGA